jgi:hypothetical protein
LLDPCYTRQRHGAPSGVRNKLADRNFGTMRRVIFAVLILLVLLLIGGCSYLMFADPAPAVTQVEKVIPNDRFAN